MKRETAQRGVENERPLYEDRGLIRICDGAVYSQCHTMPILEGPVFYMNQSGAAEQVGIAWYCPWDEPKYTHNSARCFKLCHRHAHFQSRIKRFKNCPDDVTSGLLDQAEAVLGDHGFGVYFGRDAKGALNALQGGLVVRPLFTPTEAKTSRTGRFQLKVGPPGGMLPRYCWKNAI